MTHIKTKIKTKLYPVVSVMTIKGSIHKRIKKYGPQLQWNKLRSQ